MYCPVCRFLLQKLDVTTLEGKNFTVEHCGRCGGTWFDPYEIHRIPLHEVVRLAHVTVLPKKARQTADELFCPRCFRLLTALTTEGISAGTRLLRCNKCNGIWATQKVLKDMQQSYTTSPTFNKDNGLKPSSFFQSLSVVFFPAVFTLGLLYVTFLTVSLLQQSHDVTTNATNLISNLQILPIGPGSVSIVFDTTGAVKSEFAFGKSAFEMAEIPISDAPTSTHRQILRGLDEHATYVYHIELLDEEGNIFTTRDASFTTFP